MSKEIFLALFLCGSGGSFNALSLPEWTAFLESMSIQLRSGEHIRTHIFPAVAGHIKKCIRTRLQSVPSFAVVIDSWDNTSFKYIGIAVQYIDNWHLRSDLLRVQQVNKSLTAEAIESVVTAAMNHYLGHASLISACVSDNGANFIKAGNLISNEPWRCVCHTLQLIIHDAFEHTPIVNAVWQTCKVSFAG
jgi:hypothetical protein